MIPTKPTWNIIDSTKISTYMACPRKFFFEYVLGWRGESEHNDLWFGSCWHVAMEHLLLNGYTGESVLEAMRMFDEKYRQKFPEYTDDLHFPKVPGVAKNSLIEYCAKYSDDTNHFDTLYTEIAGTVPISETRVMTFKMDSILRDRWTGRIRSREHKTAKQGGRRFEDKFKMATQVGTYDHVIKCLFGPDQCDCIEINGAIFLKGVKYKGESPGKVEFMRVEIPRYADMSNAWLFNVNAWHDDLDRDMDRLTSCTDDDPCLRCFKQNVESCTDYWGCPYHAFCLTWANPLQHLDCIPIGFEERHWNPMEEETIRKVVNL